MGRFEHLYFEDVRFRFEFSLANLEPALTNVIIGANTSKEGLKSGNEGGSKGERHPILHCIKIKHISPRGWEQQPLQIKKNPIIPPLVCLVPPNKTSIQKHHRSLDVQLRLMQVLGATCKILSDELHLSSRQFLRLSRDGSLTGYEFVNSVVPLVPTLGGSFRFDGHSRDM